MSQTAMPDGNTAALRTHEAEQDRRAKSYDASAGDFPRLLADYIADCDQEHEERLQELLTEAVGDNKAFLHCLQRIHVIAQRPITPESQERITTAALRMLKLFSDQVDVHEGDDILNRAADALDAQTPCRCRGDCYC